MARRRFGPHVAFAAAIVTIMAFGYTLVKDWRDSKRDIGRAVVPPQIVSEVSAFKERPSDAFQLLRDVSLWDLRQWTPWPDGLGFADERRSAVNYTNYLLVRKERGDVRFFRATYGTTGAAIDLRCLTHEADISLSRSNPKAIMALNGRNTRF